MLQLLELWEQGQNFFYYDYIYLAIFYCIPTMWQALCQILVESLFLILIASCRGRYYVHPANKVV